MSGQRCPTFEDALDLYRQGEEAMRRADAAFVTFDSVARYRAEATSLFAQASAAGVLLQTVAAGAAARHQILPEGQR